MKTSKANFIQLTKAAKGSEVESIIEKATRKHKVDSVFYSVISATSLLLIAKVYHDFKTGLVANPAEFAKLIDSWKFNAQAFGFILIAAYALITFIVAYETIASTPLNELTVKELKKVNDVAMKHNLKITNKNEYGFYEIKKGA